MHSIREVYSSIKCKRNVKSMFRQLTWPTIYYTTCSRRICCYDSAILLEKILQIQISWFCVTLLFAERIAHARNASEVIWFFNKTIENCAVTADGGLHANISVGQCVFGVDLCRMTLSYVEKLGPNENLMAHIIL